MSRAKILIDFSKRRFSDLELQMKAQLIVNRMTDNPHFLQPKPSLMEFKQATEQYGESLIKSKEGTKADTLVKKNNRMQLQRLLYTLANYVYCECDGNGTLILNSGFDIQKKSGIIGPLPQPTGFSVRYGQQSGGVILRCDVIKKADLYQFQYTMEPLSKDSVWEHINSTKRTLKIEGLEKDRYYSFRVAGTGSDPSRNYTDSIRKMVV